MHAILVQQRSTLKGGLKRTRQKFISPLLSQKKPKLATAESEEQHTATEATTTHSDHINSSHATLARARLDFKDTQKNIATSEGSEPIQQSEEVALNSSESSCIGGDAGDGSSVQLLEEEKRSLEAKLKEREETLRKLKMVKMYRTKNNLQELTVLTAKWREVAQEAAETLLESSTHQPRPSMAQMLDYLCIDHQLIHYCDQDESFY